MLGTETIDPALEEKEIAELLSELYGEALDIFFALVCFGHFEMESVSPRMHSTMSAESSLIAPGT